MKKKFKIVMLPTEKADIHSLLLAPKGKLHKCLAGGEWRRLHTLGCKPQHLYILSDEEIKLGDWWYDTRDRYISNNPLAKNFLCKKIVATTDDLMLPIKGKFDSFHPKVSGLPESFIQSYIKAYNEGNPITEVELEMEEDVIIADNHGLETIYCIKTTPDNEVIPSIISNKTYTRNEVIKLLRTAWRDSDSDGIIQDCCGQVDTAEPTIEKSFNKWVKENLQ